MSAHRNQGEGSSTQDGCGQRGARRMDLALEDRIQSVLDQLEAPDLTQAEVDALERKLEILREQET